MKNEIVALWLSYYCVDKVAALKKENKPFILEKLQKEIDSDGTKIPAAAAAGKAVTSTVAAATAATATTNLVRSR
jgi:hypothetical protein